VRDTDVDPELPTYSREVEPGATGIPVPTLREGDIADAAAPPAYMSPTTATGSGLPGYTSPITTTGERHPSNNRGE
jgi:hypothetical protein